LLYQIINKMNKFKIVPISKSYAANIRSSHVDDFGNKVIEQVATGSGPCRVSLRPFNKGIDKRLLIKHSPFEKDNAFNQPGPIFISSDEVEEYSDIYHFPLEIKNNKKSFPLSLIGYDSEQQMVFTQLVGEADVDELIIDILDQNTGIEYLHARNAEACCFICKIERV
jgi:hypothetical protein